MAKALVVAAPASGSGKTVLTLGLLRAFRDKGVRVASAKVGPDYIDPRYHQAASGRPCFNLDPWAMPEPKLRALLADLAADVDLVIVEGVMGLFDGPQGAAGSTADLAMTLGLPILLVVDAQHQGQSIAALVHGFANYRPGLALAGVVANRVGSDRHAAILKEALGEMLFGQVRRTPALDLPSRHLGLLQAEEHQSLESFIASAASTIARAIDLTALRGQAAEISDALVTWPSLPPLGQRIAVATDMAFAFAYPHLLQDWRRSGAEILPFSPLANEAPNPGADAVFLPGGYPELHAGTLAANTHFLDGLRQAKGLVYGECGGYMVLGEALIDGEGASHAMAGLLPLTTSFASRKLHLGYRQLKPLGGLPWTTPLRGHEFHYSTVTREGAADRLFEATDAAGHSCGSIGLRRGPIMGSYAHIISATP